MDARFAYPALLGAGLNWRIGRVCYNGQGYNTPSPSMGPGIGNVPNCKTAWSSYWNGFSRLDGNGKFSPQPQYILSFHGTNDALNTWDTPANMASLWRAWRTASTSTTPILICVPFNGYGGSFYTASSQDYIKQAYTLYQQSYNDPCLFLVTIKKHWPPTPAQVGTELTPRSMDMASLQAQT